MIDAVATLVVGHGLLEIEWGNGSALVAEATRGFLESHGVLPLDSPPGLSPYL